MEIKKLEVLRVEVAKLYCKPGDVVVLKFGNAVSDATFEFIKRSVIGLLPDGVRVMVLDPNVSISVITPETIEPVAHD